MSSVTTIEDVRFALLKHLELHNVIENSWEFAKFLNVDHEIVVGIMSSLKSKSMVSVEGMKVFDLILTSYGGRIMMDGTHMLRNIPNEGITQDDLAQKRVGDVQGFHSFWSCFRIYSEIGQIHYDKDTKLVTRIDDKTENKLEKYNKTRLNSTDVDPDILYLIREKIYKLKPLTIYRITRQFSNTHMYPIQNVNDSFSSLLSYTSSLDNLLTEKQKITLIKVIESLKPMIV